MQSTHVQPPTCRSFWQRLRCPGLQAMQADLQQCIHKISCVTDALPCGPHGNISSMDLQLTPGRLQRVTQSPGISALHRAGAGLTCAAPNETWSVSRPSWKERIPSCVPAAASAEAACTIRPTLLPAQAAHELLISIQAKLTGETRYATSNHAGNLLLVPSTALHMMPSGVLGQGAHRGGFSSQQASSSVCHSNSTKQDHQPTRACFPDAGCLCCMHQMQCTVLHVSWHGVVYAWCSQAVDDTQQVHCRSLRSISLQPVASAGHDLQLAPEAQRLCLTPHKCAEGFLSLHTSRPSCPVDQCQSCPPARHLRLDPVTPAAHTSGQLVVDAQGQELLQGHFSPPCIFRRLGSNCFIMTCSLEARSALS